MAQVDFVLKKGDPSPAIKATLKDSAGTAVNLTDAAVKFLTRQRGQTTNKVDAAATIDNASGGKVSYAWAAVDVDSVGEFDAEWEVTYSTGLKQTFPSDGYLAVRVVADLS